MKQQLGARPTNANDTADKLYVDTVSGQRIVWTGTAWPTLSASGLTGYAGVITWDSSNDIGATQPTEWRSQDNWLKASTSIYASKRIVQYMAVPGGTAFTSIWGMAAPTVTGTGTAAAWANTSLYTRTPKVEAAVTTASTSAVAGWREATATYTVTDGFQLVARFSPSRGNAANSTRRIFCGLTSGVAAPTDAQPSAQVDVLGVGADTADTNYFFMERTASGTVVRTDTGIPKTAADSTEVYELTITVLPGATTAYMTFKRLTTTPAVASRTTGTSIPGSTTALAWRAWSSVGGTSSAIGMAVSRFYLESDT